MTGGLADAILFQGGAVWTSRPRPKGRSMGGLHAAPFRARCAYTILVDDRRVTLTVRFGAL
jgi:hypothetical protein